MSTVERNGPKSLVDDDKDLLQLIALRLRAAGYAVRTAESGEAALASLSAERPHLVVSDLRMHGMDGLALFDAIRREAPDLPVVILTAHGTIPEAVDATRRGVFGFLTKPFDSKVLLDTVADALRLSGAPHGEGEEWREGIIALAGDGKPLLGRAASQRPTRRLHLRRQQDRQGIACARDPSFQPAARPVLRSTAAPFRRPARVELSGHKERYRRNAGSRGPVQAARRTLFLDEVGDMRSRSGEAVAGDRGTVPGAARSTIPSAMRILFHTAARSKADRRRRVSRTLLPANVVRLVIPLLSERRKTFLACQHFVSHLGDRYGRERIALSPEAVEVLVAANWPERAPVAERNRAIGRALAGSDPCRPRARNRPPHAPLRRWTGAPMLLSASTSLESQDYGQRDAGCAACRAQPHGVLSPSGSSRASAVDVQDVVPQRQKT